MAFIIVFGASLLLYRMLSVLSFKKREGKDSQGKPYACGEDVAGQAIQPDYRQFFPFVFFFTIMHVVAIFIATIPAMTAGSLLIDEIYILSAVIALFIIYRK